MIPTLFGMSLISFAIIQLPPGDYLTSVVATMTDSGQTIDPAQLELLKTIYGFDQPFYVQYAKWIWGIVSRGDFGYSFEWNQPVAGLIWDRMGSTLVISILSLLFVWIVSLPIGLYSAVRRNSIGDHVFTLIGFLGLAVPNFLLALTLMYRGLPVFRAERRRAAVAGVRRAAMVARPSSAIFSRICGSRSSSSALRHGRADPHPARQPDRRTAQALCHHGTGEGTARVPGDPDLSACASR